MKRFRFRLRRLERLRRMTRQQAQVALARRLRTLDERRAKREAAERSLADATQGWHHLAGRGVADGATLRQAAANLDAVRRVLDTARAAERSALADVESARREVVDRSREHRALERLHVRRRQRWLEEAGREEQRFLDELYLLTRGSTRARRERDA